MATPISSYTPQVSGGTTTSWLPITSAWPSIAECSIGYWPLDGLAVAFDPSIGASNTLLRCLPTEASLWWTQAIPTPVFTVTSLGPLVCPSAYYVASRSVINSLTTFTACCPLGYSFSGVAPPGTYANECTSTFTSGYRWTFYTASTSTGPWTLTSTVWGTGPAGLVHAVALNGYNYGETTRSSSFSSASFTVSTTSIKTFPSSFGTSSTPSASATSSASNPASSSSSNENSTGFSGASKAPLVIGIILCVLGVCFALGAWHFIRKHQRKLTAPSAAAGIDRREVSRGRVMFELKPELDAFPRAELESLYPGGRYMNTLGSPIHYELDDQSPRHSQV